MKNQLDLVSTNIKQSRQRWTFYSPAVWKSAGSTFKLEHRQQVVASCFRSEIWYHRNFNFAIHNMRVDSRKVNKVERENFFRPLEFVVKLEWTFSSLIPFKFRLNSSTNILESWDSTQTFFKIIPRSPIPVFYKIFGVELLCCMNTLKLKTWSSILQHFSNFIWICIKPS